MLSWNGKQAIWSRRPIFMTLFSLAPSSFAHFEYRWPIMAENDSPRKLLNSCSPRTLESLADQFQEGIWPTPTRPRSTMSSEVASSLLDARLLITPLGRCSLDIQNSDPQSDTADNSDEKTLFQLEHVLFGWPGNRWPFSRTFRPFRQRRPSEHAQTRSARST